MLATNNSGTPTDTRLTTLTVSNLSIKAWAAASLLARRILIAAQDNGTPARRTQTGERKS
jgi:hypothetical protein